MIFLFLLFFSLHFYDCKDFNFSILAGGGYRALWCIPSTQNFIRLNGINCIRNSSCGNTKYFYICSVECGLIPKRHTLERKFIFKFDLFDLEPKLINKDNTSHLIISNKYMDTLYLDDIWLQFNHTNISCVTNQMENGHFVCQLNKMEIKKRMTIGIEFCVGRTKCRETKWCLIGFCGPRKQCVQLDDVLILQSQKKNKLWMIAFVLIPALILCFIISILLTTQNKRRFLMRSEQQKKQLTDHELLVIKIQKKAFLEYQTAVDSFPHLGSLTHRHILGFDDFCSRILSLEWDTGNNSNHHNESTLDLMFESLLLDKNRLIGWIEKIEQTVSVKQRNTIASLLTIALFQHPQYFLEVIETMLLNYLTAKVKTREEITAFRGSTIIEKMMGDWISICLYPSIKNGEIGRRFFNLYRAVKCKIDKGLVDCLTNKAKFALSFEQMLYTDRDYDELTIFADVDIELNMKDSREVLQIKLQNIEVFVLSMDSISQVTQKILDRAIMVFCQSESAIPEDCDVGTTIIWPNPNMLFLYLTNNTMKIRLDDIDRTSEIVMNSNSSICDDQEFVVINTMKHYNMKSGQRFLLTTISKNDIIDNSPDEVSSQLTKLHLQTEDKILVHKGESQKASKKTKSPTFENNEMTKEVYLMVLMATKKSLYPFIEGLFQCITNCRSSMNEEDNKSSLNSLFEISTSMESPSFGQQSQLLSSGNMASTSDIASKSYKQHLYLIPIYYMFNMLDNIYLKLNIDNQQALAAWKSNSLILRYWVNLIKNPDFVFFVNRTEVIDASMTTIATVFMESCSVASSSQKDIYLPTTKQLFFEEARNKYPKWWQNLLDKVRPVEENKIISIMTEINEQYNLEKHYTEVLSKLKEFSNKNCPEIFGPPDILLV